MRRYVSAATASTATLTAPVMGMLATWQFVHFHSSARLLGRKQGGPKKLGAAASSTPAPEAAALSGGKATSGAGKTPDDHTASSAATSAAPSTGTNTDSLTQNVGIEPERKPQRDRDPRKAMQNPTERFSPPIQEKESTRPSGRQRETTSIRRRVADGSTSASSPSVCVRVEKEMKEDEVVAERASITKLFMVSDSVASIFCALPQDQRSIDNYLREVDQAVVPKPLSERYARGTNAKGNSDAMALSMEAARQSASTAKREIAQRILFEERADHALCIHVRDMEQLVPPRHLLQNDVSRGSPSKKMAGGQGRRSSSKRGKKIPPVSHSSVAAAPTLVPLERVLALQHWQSDALKKARESQDRHQIPEDYHAITRVRFHDPHRADLTVVQGCGGSKSVVDVLAVMNRNLKSDNSVVNEDDISDDELSPAEESSMSALLSTPFALKPLLSVVASCIPRREPALGSRCDEEMFSRSTTAATPRKAKKSEGAVDATKTAATGAGSPGTLRREGRQLGRRVPPMPRFTTRVTVLVEHDELQPVDLFSMAGKSAARKDDRKKLEPHKKNEPQVYCLIADGGEF